VEGNMNTVHEINEEIKRLEEKLASVKGRATEVYSRIVGYYRSVSNWNAGKRAEFDERLAFDMPDNPLEDVNAYGPKEKDAVLSA
jgi:hypothetical protein